MQVIVVVSGKVDESYPHLHAVQLRLAVDHVPGVLDRAKQRVELLHWGLCLALLSPFREAIAERALP
jgi:hypothetical protein